MYIKSKKTRPHIVEYARLYFGIESWCQPDIRKHAFALVSFHGNDIIIVSIAILHLLLIAGAKITSLNKIIKSADMVPLRSLAVALIFTLGADRSVFSTVPTKKHTLYILSMLAYPDPNNVSSLNPTTKDAEFLQRGAHLAVEEINNRSDILADYRLEVIEADCGCNLYWKGVISFTRYLYGYAGDKQIVGLIGPECSDSTLPIAALLARPQVSLVNIHLATSTLLSNRTLYPYSFGILPPRDLVVEAYLALFKYNNWTRAASLYNPLKVTDSTAYKLLEQKLKKTGVELSFTSEATTSYLPLDALKSTNVRVIVTFLRDDTVERLLCIAYHLKMVYPRYQWIFQFAPPNSANVSFTYGGTFYSCTTEQLTMVVQRSITLVSIYAITNLTRVTNLTDALLHSTCNPYRDCFALFDAAWALALALNRSAAQAAGTQNETRLSNYRYGNSIFTEMVRQELEKVQFRGAVGDVRFSKDNGYISNVQIVVKQYFDGYIKIASLKPGADVSIDVNAISFVSSSFNEVTVTIPLAMAVVVIVVNVAAVFLIAIIHVINTRYHEVNTIKASSPRLNHFAYIGCYMIVLASLVNTTMEAFLLGHGLSTVMCNVFPWFVMLGFTLVFGTVLVKTGRLYFIFKSSLNLQRTSSVVVGDYTLTFIVIVFALVGAVLCTVWSVFDASVRIYVRKPTGTPDGNLEVRIKGQCSSKYQLNFIAAIVAYLAVLIMCCVVLAISNRTITWKEFKSNGVILLVYMLLLTNGTCGGVYYVVWYAAFDNAIAYAMLSLMLAVFVLVCSLLHLSHRFSRNYGGTCMKR